MGFKIPRSKYNNKTAFAGDIKFSSIQERDFYLILLRRKAAGKIKHIECQPKVYLTPARILMRPDFLVTNSDDTKTYIEVKGFETAVYKLKKKLWGFFGPGQLDVMKLKRKEWVLEESVTSLAIPQ